MHETCKMMRDRESDVKDDILPGKRLKKGGMLEHLMLLVTVGFYLFFLVLEKSGKR